MARWWLHVQQIRKNTANGGFRGAGHQPVPQQGEMAGEQYLVDRSGGPLPGKRTRPGGLLWETQGQVITQPQIPTDTPGVKVTGQAFPARGGFFRDYYPEGAIANRGGDEVHHFPRLIYKQEALRGGFPYPCQPIRAKTAGRELAPIKRANGRGSRALRGMHQEIDSG